MAIFTLTLNPSLDRTLSVPALEPGAILHTRVVREDWGGKGINVSRALRALGIPSRIVGLFGGRTGRALHEGLGSDGYEVEAIEVKGETRQNLTLCDETANRYTKLNEPGPTVDESQLRALEDRIDRLARPGDLWALSGSVPPGAPSDTYAKLVTRLRIAGALVFLDASGAALELGLRAAPYAAKPNLEEAAALLGATLNDAEGERKAVRRLLATTKLAVLTLGARGLLLATEGVVLRAVPPQVPARSPIGAGDATLAGLLWAVSEGCGPEETARRSVACGTAAAMQEGTGVGDADRVRSLVSRVAVERG